MRLEAHSSCMSFQGMGLLYTADVSHQLLHDLKLAVHPGDASHMTVEWRLQLRRKVKGKTYLHVCSVYEDGAECCRPR